MTHVFVVNERTFKYHLEYMFAGTGYGENEPDFIENEKISNKSDNVERTFASMIADISKLRKNDLVAFYVTGCQKLFGFFKVDSNPFYNDKKTNYLGGELDKYLPFRVKLKPYLVYQNGITEHEALDEIYNIKHPYEMCWSLIYRKLTGMRGCTAITDYESQRFMFLLRLKNKKPFYAENYTYDNKTQQIVESKDGKIYKADTSISLDIKNRFKVVTNAHETHLQAYVLQNYDGNLKSLLLPDNYTKLWIGNEVVCSVGEQRIDILLISETKDNYIIRIIELKDEKPTDDIVKRQMIWYIKWVLQYITPFMSDKPVIIKPTIIAAKFLVNTTKKKNFYDACKNANYDKMGKIFKVNIDPIEYISYSRQGNITFEKVF